VLLSILFVFQIIFPSTSRFPKHQDTPLQIQSHITSASDIYNNLFFTFINLQLKMSHNSTDNCTSVSPECPVDLTIYGYYPNLGANAFFSAYFAIFLIANLVLGFRHRTWVFSSLVAIGCVSEMIGYIGRIMLHSNPWSNAGFEIQICTLIFAPVSFPALPRPMILADSNRSHS
jgi:RTA1 like protein